MSSSPSHATITYTSMSNDDDCPDQASLSPAHAPVYPEYLAPSDDDLEPPEAQPLPASEEPFEEEEEKLSAPADSLPAGLYIDLPSEAEEDEVSSTPPSPTSHHHIIPLSQTGLHLLLHLRGLRLERVQQPLLTDYGFVTALEEVNERVTDLVTSHRHDSKEFHVRYQDAQDDEAVLRASVSSLEKERRYHRTTAIAAEQEATYARQAWTHVMDYIRGLQAEIRVLQQ
ncbi:hypothetical protein Tco_1118577 [Tanacetum coccineum]